MATLASALGQRAVSANNPPPGQVGVIDLEEDRTGEAGCARRDVAVGAHEPFRNLAHASEDFEQAGFAVAGQEATGPKAAMIRFWYSESSSDEMK